MPVIGHRGEREDGQRNLGPCLVQDAEKRIVVVRFLENGHACHRPIEDVEHFIRRADAAGSGHPGTLPPQILAEKRPDPCSSPFLL